MKKRTRKDGIRAIGALLATLAVILLPAVLQPAAANGAASHEGAGDFREVMGKEWILAEIRIGSSGGSIIMDRHKLEAENMGGVYTASFNESQISGMGAPNRYFAPYTVGSNKSLSIKTIASTMMLAFREPEGLKESEYIKYLSQVVRWDLKDGKLELFSSNGTMNESTLVFNEIHGD